MSPISAVRTVVVPAAGWGTRFLPATRAVPKELLPLIDKPVIHYGLEEATGLRPHPSRHRDLPRQGRP